MILLLIVILLVGGVAFFHYKQGFFSATLSAILATISAIVALSYQEVIARSVLQGKMADLANAVALVVLFALTFLILRIIFDLLAPGNVTVPVTLNKIGGALGGAVAGLIAAGVLVTAAQMLPFGPSILGYTRFEVSGDPIPVTLPPPKQNTPTALNFLMKGDKIEDAVHSHLLLPVDDLVVGITSHVSSGGALAGQSMAAVHESYLDELFLQRLGVQAGAKHVAVNVAGGASQASVQGVFALNGLPPLKVLDAEFPAVAIHDRWSTAIEPTLKTTGSDAILVIRVMLSREAADTDGNARLSPGSVRLCVNGKNYFPFATLDWYDGVVVRKQRIDDFLVVTGGGTADFVFRVPAEELGLDLKGKPPFQLKPDTFLEVKRLAMTNLSGREVKMEMPPAMSDGAATVLRKESLHPPKPKPETPPTPATPEAAPASGPAAPETTAAPPPTPPPAAAPTPAPATPPVPTQTEPEEKP